jgi:predicted ATPase
MLTSWTVEHFKSASRRTQLELAPLTIFAGANSSGKSTIIQSMLLTAQTLQSPVLARPVVLNGHIARLGAFTDLVSDADENSEISIGFRLEFAIDDRLAFRTPLLSRALARRQDLQTRPRIDCSYTFSMRGNDPRQKDLLRLQPRLERCEVSVDGRSDEDKISETLFVERSKNSIADRIRELKLPEAQPVHADLNTLSFEIARMSAHKPDRRLRNLAARKNAGASIHHFLPYRLTIAYDAVETEVRNLVDALTAPIAGEWTNLDIEERQAELSENVETIIMKVIDDLVETEANQRTRMVMERRISDLRERFSISQLHRFYRLLPISIRAIVAERINEKREELRQAIRGDRTSRYDLRYAPLPELLSAGTQAIRQFFSFSVKYLGPLRDEPKPVYPLVGTTGLNDVGFRGEHTAAVLDINRNTTVEYVPSACFAPDSIEQIPARDTLQNTVLDWLDYMGVGTSLRTIDRGKLGHELKVATAGTSTLHDLTQVGVGVSQVLPILVLSLLADQGATLIFEQPELHLHPRVQTRLADFFVAMSHLGKQCIVETHSEYLINRLRFRAATARDSEISDAVVLYFVEKDSTESTYRKLRMNEYGVIHDWPAGFFDESDANAAATLKAGVAKRKRKQKTTS